MKIRLLIASSDGTYANHLSRVLAEKHAEVFEVSICSSEERMQEVLSNHRFDAALLERQFLDCADLREVRLPLELWDDASAFRAEAGKYPPIRKYQRISSIIRDVLAQYAAISSNKEVFGNSQAHITAVWSPAGGSGKTTTALAYAAQKVAGGKSISSLFEKLDSNIELLLQSVRQQDSDSGIYYFCQPENYDDINILTTADVMDLIDGCARGSDELVIDLSSICDEKTCEILKMADTVFVVLDASRTDKAKWEQFRTQNDVYERIRSKTVLVANRGAQADNAADAATICLPYVQSANPVVVYKTLYVNFK